MRFIKYICTAVCVVVFTVTASPGAERSRIENFLKITGFDVALNSIRLSAETAPQLLGMEAEDFGYQWSQIANEVFATDIMQEKAIGILSETLSDDLLEHALAFYTSELGQRLVEVENESHMFDDDDLKTESGEAIINGLMRIGSPRVDILKRMNAASDSTDTAIRAIQEVQVRFLMAAAVAGVIELNMDEADLRELLRNDEPELSRSLRISALTGSAYTYQAFSDEEVELYTQALEHPKMKKVYNLMNAVQFEIMADRYEVLARRMRNLKPSEDL